MFNTLKGKTITEIEGLEKGSDNVYFQTSDDKVYKMYHEQGCCESVEIEDIVGDVNDILNSEILLAEKVSKEIQYESATWTFYKLSTINGSITIRWYGTSNGYYSEEVDFKEMET